ncbi:NAD-dependent epimerase/dehydratase family protein [Streptomyces acidiscabies]|uniref:NAD-dependent epimerase/dehydratase family protein n=1 Tax=Streptomyces acidiscabies TaxID=42234 RepID=UPI0009513763|nr:NAD-dependent epimerase/dehydratase family protein [Streptomyces acidiscabies]
MTPAYRDLAQKDVADSGVLKVVSLRYFNPIGADPELRSGLQIRRPTHALGRMIDVHHTGETSAITGTGWPTRDGSGIRDYVHVWDHVRDGHRPPVGHHGGRALSWRRGRSLYPQPLRC